MKKILVPIDFSECSKNALKIAAKLANKIPGSEITMVHVYEKPVYGLSLQFGVDNKELKAYQDQLSQEILKESRQNFLSGISVHTALLADIEVWEVVNHDIIKDQDIIVMGTHGIKGVRDFFIGSNAEKVIRTSPIPVLTVKQNQEDFDFSDIVFASEFNEKAKLKFPVIQKFAEIFESKLHLLKIIGSAEDMNKALESIEEFAKNSGLTGGYSAIVETDRNVEDGILNYSEKVNVDVIAMETHGRTGIAHIINGSLTEDVANHADRYVLSIKMST
ncbi:MAG: universal stress protein [Flavobacteriales bacterium]|nr:universal stress protein [Flavobacteriales bacterium]